MLTFLLENGWFHRIPATIVWNAMGAQEKNWEIQETIVPSTNID